MKNGKRYGALAADVRRTVESPMVGKYRIGVTTNPDSRKKQFEREGWYHFRILQRFLGRKKALAVKSWLIRDLAKDPSSEAYKKMDPVLRVQANNPLPGARAGERGLEHFVILAFKGITKR